MAVAATRPGVRPSLLHDYCERLAKLFDHDRAESALLALHEQQARASAAEAACAAAAEADRAKTEFLIHLGDGLRVPVNSIIGFSELIAKGLAASPEHTGYLEYAQGVKGSGYRLLDIADSLADLARLEAGALTLKEETLELRPLIEASIEAYRPSAAARRVELRTNLPEDLPAIRGDRIKLRRVLHNLLSNAIRFTAESGVVEVTAQSEPGQGAWVQISDTGAGIAPEALEHVFEPFHAHRVHADGNGANGDNGANGAGAKDSTRLGIGLALAKKLVEAHGGKLSIESMLGVGTQVTVALPSKRLSAVPNPGAHAAPQPAATPVAPAPRTGTA
jgi:signal transduction histidine kinase